MRGWRDVRNVQNVREMWRCDAMGGMRRYLAFITTLFAASIAYGYVYALLNPSDAAAVVSELAVAFEWIKDSNPLLILLIIFLNNAIKSLAAIIFGVIIIIPIGFIAFNGYILGIVFCEYARTVGHAYVAAAILPHGVIELPMVLLSAALGTRIGVAALLRIIGDAPAGAVMSEMKRSVSFYFRWILPLLFVAAVIETFVTPIFLWLMGW